MPFHFFGKMSLPQNVYFSISNFWYKLTQPNVQIVASRQTTSRHSFRPSATLLVLSCASNGNNSLYSAINTVWFHIFSFSNDLHHCISVVHIWTAGALLIRVKVTRDPCKSKLQFENPGLYNLNLDTKYYFLL